MYNKVKIDFNFSTHSTCFLHASLIISNLLPANIDPKTHPKPLKAINKPYKKPNVKHHILQKHKHKSIHDYLPQELCCLLILHCNFDP